MSLKALRIIQWVVGVLLLVYGIYLIVGIQEFFGILAIIAAFFIFPTLNKNEKDPTSKDYYAHHDYNNDSTNEAENSSWSSDSEGGD